MKISTQYPNLQAEVESRAGIHFGEDAEATAERDLDRYYRILRDEQAQLNLTEAEATLIVSVIIGTRFDTRHYRAFWMGVEDAVQYEGAVAEQCGLDSKQAKMLVERLRALSPGASMALVDAVECFWNSDMETDTVVKLREAGLLQ